MKILKLYVVRPAGFTPMEKGFLKIKSRVWKQLLQW